MPLNTHFQFIQKLSNREVKTNKTILSHHTARSTNFRPLQIAENNIRTPHSNSKRSSSKNSLKNSKIHGFETLELRAMLKKAKQVSPSQTFLPPKSPKASSGVNVRFESNQMNKNSGLAKENGVESGGILGQQIQKSNKYNQKEIYNKEQAKEDLFCLQQQKEEMGSLSRIIFFGDMDQNSSAQKQLLLQRISRGEQLQCQQLLQHLEGV